MEGFIRLLEAAQPVLETAAIYAIGTVGLLFVYRYLRFPDFTILGSIICGGTVCIWTANWYGSTFYGQVLGLFGGTCVGMLLGILTAGLISLSVSKVLAGIITFTASVSLAFWTAPDGTATLSIDRAILYPTFNPSDFLLIVALWWVVVVALCLFIETKGGIYVIGLRSDPKFVAARHRRWKSSTAVTMTIGNGIVGLAGALDAINSGTAAVQNAHTAFLQIGLAGVMTGATVQGFVAQWLFESKLLPSGDRGAGGIETIRPTYLASRTAAFLGRQRREWQALFLTLATSSVGAFLLTVISLGVGLNVMEANFPGVRISPDWQYAVVAIVMTGVVLVHRRELEDADSH